MLLARPNLASGLARHRIGLIPLFLAAARAVSAATEAHPDHSVVAAHLEEASAASEGEATSEEAAPATAGDPARRSAICSNP